MALTDSEKKLLLKDYSAWTGGFTPDEDDRHRIYIHFAMPHSLAGKTREVFEFLTSYVAPKKEKK